MANPELKFNLSNCLEYIKSFTDFTINREIGRDDVNMRILNGPVSVREDLTKFIIECKKESEANEHDFIKWLENREIYWRNIQYSNVSAINAELETAKGERKVKLDIQKGKVISLCNHYYTLIKMIKEDIYNGLGSPKEEQLPTENKETSSDSDQKQGTHLSLPEIWNDRKNHTDILFYDVAFYKKDVENKFQLYLDNYIGIIRDAQTFSIMTDVAFGNYLTVNCYDFVSDYEIHDFLDYHYNKYAGNKKKFVEHTRVLIMVRGDGRNNKQDKIRFALATEWVNEKRKELKSKEKVEINRSPDTDIISFDYEKNTLGMPDYFLPENIRKYYMDRNEFIYLNTKTAKGIPVIRTTYELSLYNREKHPNSEQYFDPAFRGYAKGFIKGFESDFIPTINTPENRKELILKGIGLNMDHGFPESHNPRKTDFFYEEDSFYKMGLEIGRNYKAWKLVFETPKYYENDSPFKAYKVLSQDGKPKQVNPSRKEDELFSQRQIAMAYCVMEILITSDNAAKILEKHSTTKSTDKLLAKRINNINTLSKLAGNKTADTKFLQDLRAAKRLIRGMKNTKAFDGMSRIIEDFETAYTNKY